MFAESDNVIPDKDFDFFGKVVAPIKREFYAHPDNAGTHSLLNPLQITCYCDPILFKSILHLNKVMAEAAWRSLKTYKDLEELTEISIRGVDFKVKGQPPMMLVFKEERKGQVKVVNLAKYLN